MKHKHEDITYTLMKSKRKTMSIYVESDGKIKVHAPMNLTQNKINHLIDTKSNWIYKSKVELMELNNSKIRRSLVNDENFLFMGKSYRLKIVKNQKIPFSLSRGCFRLDEEYLKKANRYFVEFYKEKCKEYIPSRVTYFKKKLGVEPEKIRIMELKTRWASLSKKSLNFHWKVILAPRDIIDYIIVHELAHIIQKDHSYAFWEIVESMMPNYEEKKNWLRRNGAKLDI